jgi:hypothetical protein
MCNGCIIFFFCFGQMTVLIGLIYVDLLIGSSFSWTLWISKSFKLPIFSAPQSCSQITRVDEIERNLFIKKCIVTLSPTTHVKLDATVHTKSHRFSILLLKPSIFHSLLTAPHRTIFHSTMTSEADQISNVAASGSQSAAGPESEVASSTSSTMADQGIANVTPRFLEDKTKSSIRVPRMFKSHI